MQLPRDMLREIIAFLDDIDKIRLQQVNKLFKGLIDEIPIEYSFEDASNRGALLDLQKIFAQSRQFTKEHDLHSSYAKLAFLCGYEEAMRKMIRDNTDVANNIMIAIHSTPWQRKVIKRRNSRHALAVTFILLLACSHGNKKIADLLIKYGATGYDDMPSNACASGDLDFVKYLMQINNGYINLDSAMRNACMDGHLHIVEFIIAQGWNNWNDDTLFNSCYGGNQAIIDLVISHNITNWNYGLGGAGYGGHLALVKDMIARGASNWNTCAHNTSMGYINNSSKLDEYTQIIKLMIEKGANNFTDIMNNACRSGNIQLVEYMLMQYLVTDINCINSGMAQACYGGHAEIVDLMVKHGANDWDEGLYYACQGGQIVIIDDMVTRGATDFNRGLQGACEWELINVTKIMMKHGATNLDVNRRFLTDEEYEMLSKLRK